MNRRNKMYQFVFGVFLTIPAYAQTGMGGGDTCEDKIIAIRDDIAAWIIAGGADALQLPYGLSVDTDYKPKMLASLAPGATGIECPETVVENSLDTVVVYGVPKTCAYHVATATKGAFIECDYTRFLSKEMSDIERYHLIHHEFASLNQIERSVGADSDYSVSDQVALYVGPETVWKLGFRKREVESTGTRLLDLNDTIKFSFDEITIAPPDRFWIATYGSRKRTYWLDFKGGSNALMGIALSPTFGGTAEAGSPGCTVYFRGVQRITKPLPKIDLIVASIETSPTRKQMVYDPRSGREANGTGVNDESIIIGFRDNSLINRIECSRVGKMAEEITVEDVMSAFGKENLSITTTPITKSIFAE